MNDTLIYVGDNLLDLYQSTIVSFSIKKIDLNNLTGRFVTYTNTFEIPETENNLIVLGFPSYENSASEKPYQFLDCRIVQRGIEVMPQGKMYISKTKGSIKINVFETIIDLFQNIKGKSIKDINPIAMSGWEAADIDSARTNTSGIVSALMHWGYSDIPVYNVNRFLPCFYYHTIITEILESTGLTISGDILTDTRFTKLVIPYPGNTFLYPESAVLPYSGKAINDGNSFGGVTSGSYYRIVLDSVTYGDSNFDLANDRYDVNSANPLSATINANAALSGVSFLSGTVLYFKLIRYRSAVETELDTATIAPGTLNETLTYTGTLLPDDQYYIVLQSDAAGSPGVTGTIDSAYLEVVTSTEISRDDVVWNELWPDVSCEDLLRDFFVRFALIPKQVNGTIVLKDLESICSSKSTAVDWSDKLVSTVPEIDFSLSYAQNNYFKYSESEDVKDPDLGLGNMAITNEVIDVNKDIYTSPFGGSLLWTSSSIGLSDGYRIAKINVYDSTSSSISDFVMEPGLRLLTVKARTTESSVTFNVSARTDYYLAYFVDDAESKDTGWEYFLGQFYFDLETSLQKSKTVTKYFNLTELDIANYDPHKMIYDGVGYYLPSIENFIPGEITKCKLFRIV